MPRGGTLTASTSTSTEPFERWVTVTDTASVDYGKTFPVLETVAGATVTYQYATGANKGTVYTPPATGVEIDLEPLEVTVDTRSLAGSDALVVGTTFTSIPTYPANGKGCIVEVGTNGISPIIGLTIRNIDLTVSNPLLPPFLPGITKATYVKTTLSDSPMPVGTVFQLASRADALSIQFRQLTDAELNVLLIGSPPQQVLPQSSSIPFLPVQTSIPAGLTLPAVGAQITVTVTPVSGGATNTVFLADDIVVVTKAYTDYSTEEIAWFQVNSVAGNNITMTFLQRPFSSVAGTVFAAGGTTEITGQTRLPIISPLVSVAEISLSASYAHVSDALNSEAVAYKVAKTLYNSLPIAYYSFKTTNVPDIDMNTHMGMGIAPGWTFKITNRTDLENFRLVSAAPLAYLPAMEVVFS